MSAFDITKKPLPEAQQFLAEYSAELRATKFPDTYIIKFNPNTRATDPAVNQLRGVIYNVDSGDIYSLGYPVPIEFKDQSPEAQADIIRTLNTTGYVVQEALDGTLLRLWFHPETKQWVLSTNGVEDANDAYWMNGISFGAMFATTLNGIFAHLNEDHVYLFALCHPLNVIVVNHAEARIYHVATYDRLTLKEIDTPTSAQCYDLGLTRPPVLQMTVDDVVRCTRESLAKPVMSAGYMVVQQPDTNGIVHRYRFENANYTKARVMRGNSNDINLVLLEHMLNKDQTVIQEFLLYYPIYQPTCVHLLGCIDTLAAVLFNEYGLRFKRHLDIFIHPLHHRILPEIHQIYMDQLRPAGKTVQLVDIRNFLLSQPAARVNQLVYSLSR
jgi:hypothetical protein